jgi:hypothetical protein
LSHNSGSSAREFFVITPYFPAAGGVLTPAMPQACPLRSAGEPTCDVRRHSVRLRKTGPGFPLTVARCHKHKGAFTLYPPGFAPYQRKPILGLAPDGTSPLPESRSRNGLGAFEGTLLEAAMDGERQVAWPRNSERGFPEEYWSTQGRHIKLASQLLGISAETGSRLREQIAAALSVDHLFLQEKSRSDAHGYHARSKAVCAVLRRLRRGAGVALRLLYCGHLIKRWGVPWSWDPTREVLERLPFRRPPIRSPT